MEGGFEGHTLGKIRKQVATQKRKEKKQNEKINKR